MSRFIRALLLSALAGAAILTCACDTQKGNTGDAPKDSGTAADSTGDTAAIPGDNYTVTDNTDGSKSVNGVIIPAISVPDADYGDTSSAKNTDVTFPDRNIGQKNSNADFLSACHIWSTGDYAVDGNDSLYSGALRMVELGSKSIKLYLTNYYQSNYTDVKWAKTYDSPLALAAGEEFSRIFALDLDTYVLGVYIFGAHESTGSAIYWAKDFSEADRELEYKQLYELTYYFCKRYAGTGKTFIIQNWESDWACFPASERTETDLYPGDESLANLVKWINTRQDAIMAARRDAGCDDVNVYQALEVNRVIDGMEGHNSVITNAVPYTYCDFYSYSSYDGADTDTHFSAALDFMLEKVSVNRTGGRSLCYIGEFGWPDNLGVQVSIDTAERIINIARVKGFSHAFYWQLFDKDGGMFLVNDKGKYHHNWNTFYRYINGIDDPNYITQQANDVLEYPLYWEAAGADADISNGLTVKNDSYDGAIITAEHKDRFCVMSSTESNQGYVYFDADPRLGSDITDITIKVTYFDDTKGQLDLTYNAAGGNPANSKSVRVSGSGEWITVEYILTDAGFADLLHQGVADFRLSGNNLREIHISRVEIYLTGETE